MEVDDVRASPRLVRAVKVDNLIVLIDTRTKGHLKLNYGRFDVTKSSFNDSNGMLIASEESCVYSVLAHKLCFDIFGVSVLVIVYIACNTSLDTCDLSVAYVYLAENRFEISTIQSKISKPVFVQASISIDSQIFVLDRNSRCLYYLASFGTPSLRPESITFEKGFGDVSLVSLEGDLSESPIQHLELPVLLYISSSNGSPIKSVDTEINVSHGKLDLWGLSSVLDLFNSSKILKNVQEELEANYRTSSSASMAETGLFSCFASLRASRGRLEVISCPQMDRWLYNLPNGPITQIYGIGGGKPLLFATSTSLAAVVAACSPQLCCSLSSPLSEFLLLNSAEDTDAVVALLENGSIIFFDLLRGLDLISTSIGTCSSILPIDIFSDTECEGILLFQPRSEPKYSKIEWYEHESLGTWSSMTLTQLKKINNSAPSANQGSNLGDSIANGMKIGNGFSGTSSVSTGVESLVNALQGRLEVSRLHLEDIQKRLEAKEKVLARALNLIASLSSASPQSLISQTNDTIPFVLDHDLSPIVGVDSVSKDQKPKKSSFSSPLPKHLHVDAVQYALVDGKYLFQLTIRNTDPENALMIQNALVSDSENEIRVFLVQRLSISSGKVGIVSATVTMLEESCTMPKITVTFLLEAVWQKKDVATSTPILVPITAVVLSPYAFSSPQIAFPVFPYTASILVKSKRLLLSGQVVSQLLKPKFQEIGGSTGNKNGSGALLSEEVHEPERTFVASSTSFASNSETSIPLMVKTRCEENVLCVDIGALDEDELLRFVQFLQSSLRNDSYHSPEESLGERRKSSNESTENSIELFENPLSAAVLSRLTTALTALKMEIRHIISFPQMITENGVGNTANEVWRWKKSFLTLQAASDAALPNV